MLTNFVKTPTKLGILLIGFGLLAVGCDSAGPNAEQEQSGDAITFEAVDGLSDRITYLDENGSTNAEAASQKSTVGFDVQSHIAPPSLSSVGTERASHLAMSNPSDQDRNLYIGYKVRGANGTGSGFGGGVDIVDAPAGGPITSAASSGGAADALVSPNVDVQEVAVKEDNGDPDALYVATAVDPDVSLPRAPQFHSIQLRNNDGLPNSDFNSDSEELRVGSLTGNTESNSPGAGTRVAKSVVASNASNVGNNNYDAFVLADTSMAYSVTTGTDNYEIGGVDSEETPVEFRSVTETSSGSVFTLAQNGTLYEMRNGSVSSTLVDLPDLSNPGFGDNDESIARLNSHRFTNYSNNELLLVALNGGGFRVVTPDGNVTYSDPGVYATDVEATDDHVYVATGDGLAVYEVKDSGLGNTDTDDGLVSAGQQSISDMGASSATDAQVNDILVDDSGSNTLLYVAKSDDGVYKLKQKNSVW